jgi:tetrahydromethanopterin S-methyltransferase subunit G
MTFISGIPSWMVLLFGFMIVSQVIRAVFGGSRTRHRKWGQLDQQEVGRLEAAINQRDVVIEDLQQRLSELESRLDFTERMIATRSGEHVQDQARIG